MNKLLFRVSKLNKSFAVPVLKNLDFDLYQGEVHALMGSNGAGKSTLCNIISGIHTPDSGDFLYNGQAYTPSTLKKSEALGICMVMQEMNLFPTLSVAENLCFRSMADRFGIVQHKAIQKRAEEALRTVGLVSVDPAQPLSQLGVGQQQLVEIASVLQQPIKLLILDEPTAALTHPQIDLLFEQINRLKAEGVGIIYISHRMDEISRIADRVSILRDGVLIATQAVADIDADRIVHLMAGDDSVDIDASEAISETTAETRTKIKEQHTQQNREVLLKVENLSHRVKNQSGGFTGFEDVSFELRAGEVLGVGGLIGSGRTELLRAIFGADQAQSGCIKLASDNFEVPRLMGSTAEGSANGIGLLVEDRKAQGLFLSGSIRDNISFTLLDSLTNKLGVINQSAELDFAEAMSEKLSIQYDSLQQSVSSLSGGNQQKTLIARLLAKDLSILLFDEPSRGVDARAKARIQTLIREQAEEGKAVLVVSSETQELLKISDRVAVMSNGRLAGIFDAAELAEEKLLAESFRYYISEQTSETTICYR
ncbi:MAG: ribose transport system ATP-binding protein [Saprospiraceae bacterium]|jgi:ribose transport system ATP-binding protein